MSVGQVLSARYEVTADVSDQQVFRFGSPNHTGYVSLEPRKATTIYVYGPGGRWRVEKTILSGLRLTATSPEAYVFAFGQNNKPLWVAALEAQNYPKGAPK